MWLVGVTAGWRDGPVHVPGVPAPHLGVGSPQGLLPEVRVRWLEVAWSPEQAGCSLWSVLSVGQALTEAPLLRVS